MSDSPAQKDSDAALTARIRELAAATDALILAHNYQRPEVQDAADITGDSLELSIRASTTDARRIVFCGVHFMAESAKILSPDKQVVLPHPGAGCPMADMITADQLRQFKREHPGGTVVTYVNSSAAVKAESDLCCTSANAIRVVSSVPTRRVLFTPDRNLGLWVRGHVDKEMILWDGYCPTHEYLTVQDVRAARAAHPGAVVVVHPECTPDVVALADAVRSTSGMIATVRDTEARTVIVATEMGLLHRLKKERPDVELVSPSRKLVCPNMKLIHLSDVLAALEAPERFEVRVPEEIRVPAKAALDRMIAVPRD